MSNGKILIVGGYGAVGRVISTTLGNLFPDEVIGEAAFRWVFEDLNDQYFINEDGNKKQVRSFIITRKSNWNSLKRIVETRASSNGI